MGGIIGILHSVVYQIADDIIQVRAVGIGYEELCEKIVEESLKQKRGL